MKRILPLAFVGLLFISLVSCGSSKAPCDAYSSDTEIMLEKNDVAER